ncbi:MAG: hypothetical protein K6T83_01055 [Alicyclobacillus sp.]|nr:hypothetical protein [Alicyclobacillus sp.]
MDWLDMWGTLLARMGVHRTPQRPATAITLVRMANVVECLRRLDRALSAGHRYRGDVAI